jgi:membrane-bound lytic murein transglycosylase B
VRSGWRAAVAAVAAVGAVVPPAAVGWFASGGVLAAPAAGRVTIDTTTRPRTDVSAAEDYERSGIRGRYAQPGNAGDAYGGASVTVVPVAAVVPQVPVDDGSGGAARPGGDLGIPDLVLAAYRRAADLLATTDPSCGITWDLLAGIGKVESSHARGGRVDAGGRTWTPILGPRLDGVSTATIRDSDGGALDGDAVWDRAVGPMQFIPGTWRAFGADGDGDGRADPHDIDDAALAAGRYLCLGSADLTTDAGRTAALLRYNRSMAYVAKVLGWAKAYASGQVRPTAVLPADAPTAPVLAAALTPTGTPTTPPATGTPTTPPPTGTPTTPPPTGTPTTPPPTEEPTTPPPTEEPTTPPPTEEPTEDPTTEPTEDPTSQPTEAATSEPTGEATSQESQGTAAADADPVG